MGSRWRRGFTRLVLALGIGGLTVVLGYQLGRPRIEALVVHRLQAAAARRGLTATVGNVRLAPSLSLELRGVVLRHPSGARLEATEAIIHPRLSWRGLQGRAALVQLSKTAVYAPAGIRVNLRPATWDVERADDRVRVALAGEKSPLALTLSNAGEQLLVDGHFVAAPLSELMEVLKDGCPVVRLGTIHGDARFARTSGGVIEFRLKAGTRGLAVASLSPGSTGCAAEAFGAPADVDAELRAVVDQAAGRASLSHLKVRTRGIEAAAQLAVTGGVADPRVTLNLDVSRMDLAEVLATAGLDLPGEDLGVATLSWHVDGRLLDPDSLAVSQDLQFAPPARPLPAIQRLKGGFVHQVETARGSTRQIRVFPDSPDFVPLAEVPPLFLRALLLSEDTDFYGHQGVDLRELPVALATNFARGGFARGASTIPQQLAKNLFLTRRKTVSRKVEEAALALLLDATLGKSRMLEIYLNVIEWGPGLYGLRPAARHYFGCEPSQLTPRQMAFLVVLIPGPVKYQRSFASGTPTPFFDGMIATLLGKLLAVGALSEEAYLAALVEPLNLQIPSAVVLESGAEPPRN